MIEDNNEGAQGMLFGLDQAKKVGDKLSVHAFLDNLSQIKFGRAMKGLESQKSLENNQFLKTIAKASGALSKHNRLNKILVALRMKNLIRSISKCKDLVCMQNYLCLHRLQLIHKTRCYGCSLAM